MNTILFAFLSTLAVGVNCVVIHLKDGDINGTTTRTKDGRIFHKFLGIPYAKPPVNELRFQPPVPVEPWIGIKDVTRSPPICVQRNDFSFGSYIGQEDCLYLNVNVPDELLNSSGKVPVVVGIHGGAFRTGSCNDYAADYFMERDVILVSMSYRMGVLGFLALNGDIFNVSNDLISGNFGLKDQSLAIRWVHENIAQFGGDPDNVTLLGESAGAVSVHFHLFSPLSKGLFQKAIIQSGSAFSPWSHFPTRYRIKHGNLVLRLDQVVALQYLHETNCLTTSDKLECLQSKSVAELLKPSYKAQPIIESNVTEGLAFLPYEPNATNYQTLVPWITGINSGEGALFSPSFFTNGSSYAKLINSNKDYYLPQLNQYFLYANESDLSNITKSVNSFYFGTEDICLETALEATNMITDALWLYPLVKTVTTGPDLQYAYLYDHRATYSLADRQNLTIDLGVCHADEIPMLFRKPKLEAKRSLQDRRVSATLLKYWINFAISSDPNRHSKEKLWKPVQTKNEHFEYLHIKSDGVTMEKDLYQDRYNFWKSLPTGWQ